MGQKVGGRVVLKVNQLKQFGFVPFRREYQLVLLAADSQLKANVSKGKVKNAVACFHQFLCHCGTVFCI